MREFLMCFIVAAIITALILASAAFFVDWLGYPILELFADLWNKIIHYNTL